MNQNNMPNVGVTPDVKVRMKVFLFYVADIVLVLVLVWGSDDYR